MENCSVLSWFHHHVTVVIALCECIFAKSVNYNIHITLMIKLTYGLMIVYKSYQKCLPTEMIYQLGRRITVVVKILHAFSNPSDSFKKVFIYKSANW